ncbi:hypothetical protein GXW78_03590 [Roseomonas terrae]|uniref:Uncharacterized protein n=1 Tax=Neoroseomonas terrae TaxID=424799 RepID=A0ABS5ECJ3_9PROT|nr:hypothetical protein [Neoroseomonas terrae]MBR0648729.1 hypothetical protein [Neoroseomonas terrae]
MEGLALADVSHSRLAEHAAHLGNIRVLHSNAYLYSALQWSVVAIVTTGLSVGAVGARRPDADRILLSLGRRLYRLAADTCLLNQVLNGEICCAPRLEPTSDLCHVVFLLGWKLATTCGEHMCGGED